MDKGIVVHGRAEATARRICDCYPALDLPGTSAH